MKTITLTVVKHTSQQVSFRVSNSHRNEEFSNTGWQFKAKNGMELTSDGAPEVFGRDCLCVQGASKDWDNKLLTVPLDLFKKYQAAVAEYNEVHADKVVKPRIEIEVLDSVSSLGDTVAFKIKSHTGFNWSEVNGQNFAHGVSNSVSAERLFWNGKPCIFIVPSALFKTIEKNIAQLNAPAPVSPLKTITFLYTKDGIKERRILEVTVENSDSYEGIDTDAKGYRKFLKSKMSQIKVVS